MTFLLRRIFSKKEPDSKKGDRVHVVEDFDETFATPKNVMSLVCLKMTHNLSDYRMIFWDILAWFEFLNIALATVSELIQMVINVRQANTFRDILNVVGLIPCTGFCILSLLKGIKIKCNVGIYENLYYELREMWPRGEVNENEDRIIRKVFFQTKYIIKVYYWCNNALIIGFLFPSYITTLRRYLGYGDAMSLTFEYWWPFDPLKPYLFELALLWQTWHGVVVIFFNSLGDMLYCTYLAHITMQFELLAHRLRRLVYVRVDKTLADSYPLAKISEEYIENKEELLKSYTNRDWDVWQQQELVAIVKRHHALIRLAGDVEQMFSFSLLVTFMYGSVIICLNGFFCILIEKWNELAYKSFLATALTQTWLLCWYGQKLLDSSHGVSEAVYECGWYNASQKVKSSLLIMLLRSRRGVCVTTFGFSIISLESYSTIIKTSWSYFTLLLNFFNTNIDTV